MTLVKSESNLGMLAPAFDLPATDGRRIRLGDFAESNPLVVMFICNHCPYVKAVLQRLVDLAGAYEGRCGFVAISSNDAQRYPDDSFERMAEVATRWGDPFPYVYDESQEVATAYGAVCTPDFFLFDADRRLAYRGRLDDAWDQPGNVTSPDLADAIEALIVGETPRPDQLPSMGCSIKWKY